MSSTSNNKEQKALEMDDTSAVHGNKNDQEIRPAPGEAKSSRQIVHVDSERDPTEITDYQKLVKAIRRGDLFKIIEIAYKNRDLLKERSRSGNGVLHIAARYRNWLVVALLILLGDDDFIYEPNGKRETPLHIAAKYGHILVVLFLLLFNEELLKKKDEKDNTPLHNAVSHGHEIIAQILIGPDNTSILSVNKSAQSPLSIAIDRRLNYIARFIIKNEECSLKHKYEGLTLLHSAVISQDHDIVVDILKTKTGKGLIGKVDTNKWNPLHYAAALGHVKIARYLAKQNPSLPYERDIFGQTPLHLAAKNDRPGVLKLLLEDYPDSIEVKDYPDSIEANDMSSNSNILHFAAKNGQVKIVELILKSPEMEDLVNSGDKEGNTPLHLAAKELHSDVVYTFCKYMNVDIRAMNNENQTALKIVHTSTAEGKEIQKHLTIKALKAAYENRGFSKKDIQLLQGPDRNAAPPQRSMSAPEVQKDFAHSERALDGTEDVQLEHRLFAAVEDIDSKRGSKEMAQTLSVMNTLIATFTFTAAFTIPGGFRSDGPNEGEAVLVRWTSFKAFVITDTISMSSSMTAAVIVFWSFWCSRSESFMDTLPLAIGLTWIGLISMTLAFVTGLFVVLSQDMALAIAVSTIGCVLPLIFYVLAPIILLISGQPAQVNPFAFSFKMVKIFLKKPIGWCSRRLPKVIRLLTRSKKFLTLALFHKILYGFIYYLSKALHIVLRRWIKALLMALPRWIKALLIALPWWIMELVIALSNRCSPRRKSSEETKDQLPK